MCFTQHALKTSNCTAASTCASSSRLFEHIQDSLYNSKVGRAVGHDVGVAVSQREVDIIFPSASLCEARKPQKEAASHQTMRGPVSCCCYHSCAWVPATWSDALKPVPAVGTAPTTHRRDFLPGEGKIDPSFAWKLSKNNI